MAFCAEFLVGAINDIVDQWHLTQTFVGLILLPIVGNAAEHVTAVTVALKDKMDLAIGVAIGSSMQIALLVTPLMVIIGWGINVPMTLYFNVYETAVMFISVLIVNYLINVSMRNLREKKKKKSTGNQRSSHLPLFSPNLSIHTGRQIQLARRSDAPWCLPYHRHFILLLSGHFYRALEIMLNRCGCHLLYIFLNIIWT